MSDKNAQGGFEAARRGLQLRLKEPPPQRLQLLVGPRQVGKTTLLLQLEAEHRARTIYVSADAPEASLPGWADTLWRRVEERAAAGPVVLLIDEVQALPRWSQWLKARFDQVLRRKLPVHVVATGSSSLQVGAGTRETMAGRFEKTTLPHWSAGQLSRLLKVPRSEAPARLVSFGGYPGAVSLWDDPRRLQEYLRASIVEPAIGRDILQLEQVRKPALLRQVFALAAAHPAEILSLEKIAGTLAEKGALETIAHYLALLHEAFLVAPLQKYAGDEIRRRKAPPKLVVLNNALLLGSRSGPPPTPATAPAEWGRWLENACLAHFLNSSQSVYYWREEPWEVDAVTTGTWGHWLVEVKSGDYAHSDLRGLALAAARFPQFRPLVICDPGREEIAQRAGLSAVAWTDFLLSEESPAETIS